MRVFRLPPILVGVILLAPGGQTLSQRSTPSHPLVRLPRGGRSLHRAALPEAIGDGDAPARTREGDGWALYVPDGIEPR